MKSSLKKLMSVSLFVLSSLSTQSFTIRAPMQSVPDVKKAISNPTKTVASHGEETEAQVDFNKALDSASTESGGPNLVVGSGDDYGSHYIFNGLPVYFSKISRSSSSPILADMQRTGEQNEVGYGWKFTGLNTQAFDDAFNPRGSGVGYRFKPSHQSPSEFIEDFAGGEDLGIFGDSTYVYVLKSFNGWVEKFLNYSPINNDPALDPIDEDSVQIIFKYKPLTIPALKTEKKAYKVGDVFNLNDAIDVKGIVQNNTDSNLNNVSFNTSVEFLINGEKRTSFTNKDIGDSVPVKIVVSESTSDEVYFKKSLIYSVKVYGVLTSGAKKDVYVNPNTSLNTVLSQISAQDVFGGSATLTVSDAEKAKYQANKLGSYTLTLNASDAYGQTASATLVVHVVDNVKPVVTLKAGASLGYQNAVKADDLNKILIITDNGTAYGGTIGEPTFKVGQTVISNSAPFQIPSSVVKTQKLSLTVSVSDSSNNSFVGQIDVPLKDDVAPVIKKKDGTALPTSVPFALKLLGDLPSAKSIFLSYFTAYDEISGDSATGHTTLTVESFPADKSEVKVGDRTVTLKATDEAGNVTIREITLAIQKDLPVFLISPNLFMTTTSSPLTADQLESTVKTMVINNLPQGATVYDWGEFDDGGYLENSTKPGIYKVRIKALMKAYDENVKNNESLRKDYLSANGTSHEIQLQVVGNATEKKLTWWEKFTMWWANFFQCFKNWISGKGWKTDVQLKVDTTTQPTDTPTSTTSQPKDRSNS